MNISLAPEILFYIGSFGVSNAFFWCVALSLFMLALTFVINRNLKPIPNRFQAMIEIFFEGAYGFIRSVVGEDEKTKKIFPFVFTLFIFILLANLATFIPGQSAITLAREEGAVPVFRAIMSDYGLVFLLTMIVVITVQIVAIAVNGPFGYIGRFINVKGIVLFFKSAAKGEFKFGLLAQGFLDFFLGIMDIVGEFAKIASLSFRLFGNMFAGEILTAVMMFLAPFFVPLPFLFLGVLTAVVQAFVFSVLTLIFITMASETQMVEENAHA